MIFATVGTQLPFPRMFESLEAISGTMSCEIIAQTADPSQQLSGITTRDFLTPDEYGEYFSNARAVVSHAGIGTVLMAISLKKPLIIMPRRVSLGEHRNDHQMATAKALSGRRGIYIVHTTDEMQEVLIRDDLEPAEEVHTQQNVDLQTYFSSQARIALGDT